MEDLHFRSSRTHSALACTLFSVIILSFGAGLTTAATFTVTTNADAGTGSLRWAITEANLDGVHDVIEFGLAATAPYTIDLLAALPQIDQPVTIDGSTQVGYAGVPLIELNGSSSSNSPALRISAGNCVVRALVINRFEGGGIWLDGGGTNTVEGCYIGTDASGMIAQGNDLFGIWSDSSPGNVIGGSSTNQRNVVSANAQAGIYVEAGSSNIVQGNFIGLNAAGTVSLINGNGGLIIDSATNALVGGTAAGEGNFISGNADAGIYLLNATGAQIQGNTIGLSPPATITTNTTSYSIWDDSDTPAISSAADTNAVELGVRFQSATEGYITGIRFYKGLGNTNTHVGHLWTSAGTLLASVIFTNETATGWQEQALASPVALDSNTTYVASYHAPNGGYSATLSEFDGQGVTNAPLRALVDGEDGDNGVFNYGPSGEFPDDTFSSANYWVDVVFEDITTTTNNVLVLSNALDGIRIEGGAGHVIGGTAAGAANVISGNGGAGVFLQQTTGCLVQGNQLGTDATGTVGLGNILAGVTIEGATNNTIGGTLSGAGNVIAGNGQDGVYLTNSVGNAVQGNWIGLDGGGDTALANGFNGVTFVSSTNNTVGGTLAGSGNVISGNAFHGVSVREQASANTVSGNLIGLNVAGTAARANLSYGVRLASRSNLVGGLITAARNVISGNGAQGISVESVSAVGNVIQGNRIGTSLDGASALGNGNAGIGISDAPGTVIGGAMAGAGNLISGNQDAGIFLLGSGTSLTLVQGNSVGTSADGNSAVPNLYEGIYLESTLSNTIGGTIPGAGNLIAGNLNWGLYLQNTSGNVIQGNQLGLAADEITALGSKFHAIELESGANNNLIGGSGAGAGNLIANSLTVYSGVRVRAGAIGNTIRANTIFSNGGLGVDLGDYQPTLNDDCDLDTGANLQQNFPILTKAAVSTSGVTVQGDLNSIAGQSYTLDFYASSVADPSGYGEGEIYLGSALISIPAGPDCTNHFVVGFPATAPQGWFISSTATDPAGNTGEFSPLVAVEPYPLLSIAPLGSPPTSVALSWTNTALGYVVDTTTNLSPPAIWVVLTNTPISTNGQWLLTLPIESIPERYYRLTLP